MESLETRLAHVEQYAYKPHNKAVNAPLAAHMAEEHPGRYAAWVAENTVGDLEDEHYMAHGLLVTEAELLADLAAENLAGFPPVFQPLDEQVTR